MNTALLLIAHGSRYAAANDDLHHLAEDLRGRGHGIVVASFLELGEPGIEAGGALCVQQGAERVVLVPYFLSAGAHVQHDLTAAREALAKRFPRVDFRLAEPLGRHPLLLDVVAERAAEALRQFNEQPLKVGPRADRVEAHLLFHVGGHRLAKPFLASIARGRPALTVFRNRFGVR